MNTLALLSRLPALIGPIEEVVKMVEGHEPVPARVVDSIGPALAVVSAFSNQPVIHDQVAFERAIVSLKPVVAAVIEAAPAIREILADIRKAFTPPPAPTSVGIFGLDITGKPIGGGSFSGTFSGGEKGKNV